MQKTMLAFILIFFMSPAFGKDIVAEDSYVRIPYDDIITIFIEDEKLWLQCRDQYLGLAKQEFLIDNLKKTLQTLVHWSELNELVMLKFNASLSPIFYFAAFDFGHSVTILTVNDLQCSMRKEMAASLLTQLDLRYQQAYELSQPKVPWLKQSSVVQNYYMFVLASILIGIAMISFFLKRNAKSRHARDP